MSETPQLVIDLRMYRMAGIGRYLQNLLPDLIPLIDASEISIFGRSADLIDEEWVHDSRITIREFRPRIFSLAEQWTALAGAYNNVDLLWTPQYNVPLLYRGKLIVTIHDLCQLAHPETLGSDLQRRYARYLLTKVAKRAAAILCVSEFTASELQNYLKVDMRKICVTYPPIGRVHDDLISHRSESPDHPFFLTVGNIKEHKNLPRLLAAFAKIQSQIPHDLVIVGKREGFLNSETQLQGLSTDIDGRVRLTGHVTDFQLKSYYRSASALIFPSFYEGFGFPLVEAMAEGCPVACSNVASLPEVAGGAALLFDPFSIDSISQALLSLATDAKLRADLQEQGRRRVLRFAGKSCAEVTAATMNRLMSA
jgi:glycosyltransferase involved in cell wall biosynthesis